MKNVCNISIRFSWDLCIQLVLITIITLFTPEPTVHPLSPPTHPSISPPPFSISSALIFISTLLVYLHCLQYDSLLHIHLCTSSLCPRFYLYMHLQTPTHTCTRSNKGHFLSASEELFKKPHTSTNRKRVWRGWSSCYLDDRIKSVQELPRCWA